MKSEKECRRRIGNVHFIIHGEYAIFHKAFQAECGQRYAEKASFVLEEKRIWLHAPRA
jgi:hypothetical protein